MDLVYEDEGLLVLTKPAGLLDAGRTEGATLAKTAARYLGYRAPQTPTLLTRLDRGCSGAVVIAKDRGTAERMQGAFRPQRAPRTYVAVVEGVPEASDGTHQAHFRRSRKGTTEVLPPDEPTHDAMPGAMHYRVEQSGNGLSLLRIRTESDLPEQVRCQLAELGHPVVGDRAYNAKRDDLGRLGLHLLEIGFQTRGGQRSLRVPTPREFREILDPSASPAPGSGGWQQVADWYADYVEKRSDHHELVVHPGVAALLGQAARGGRVLDVACGQGALASYLLDQAGQTPPEITGVDLAAGLIEHASEKLGERARFMRGDARALSSLDLEPESFDAAACVLALMNIEPIGPVFDGVAGLLRPGGVFVAVVLHPAFRVPQSSDWAWQETADGPVQLRRVSRYLSNHEIEIVMNPGEVAEGAERVVTTTHHRSLSAYVSALSAAGLLIDAVEEWTSTRHSDSGPRAEAENFARREFPLFLAIRAVKPDTTAG